MFDTSVGEIFRKGLPNKVFELAGQIIFCHAHPRGDTLQRQAALKIIFNFAYDGMDVIGNYRGHAVLVTDENQKFGEQSADIVGDPVFQGGILRFQGDKDAFYVDVDLSGAELTYKVLFPLGVLVQISPAVLAVEMHPQKFPVLARTTLKLKPFGAIDEKHAAGPCREVGVAVGQRSAPPDRIYDQKPVVAFRRTGRPKTRWHKGVSRAIGIKKRCPRDGRGMMVKGLAGREQQAFLLQKQCVHIVGSSCRVWIGAMVMFLIITELVITMFFQILALKILVTELIIGQN